MVAALVEHIGAAIGSILGGAGDDITNDLLVNENQVSNDGVAPGDANDLLAQGITFLQMHPSVQLYLGNSKGSVENEI